MDGEYYCNGCSWQCCGEQCECGAGEKINGEQCHIFRENDIYAAWDSVSEPTLSMDFMGPHRLLLAMKKDPDLRELLKIDMHNDLRKKRYNIKYYVDCEEVIAKYISDQCGLTGFTQAEILTSLGLFDLLGVPFKNGAKAFFPELASVKHSCRPNSYFHVNADGTILMKASVNIRKGEMVTRSVVDVMKCSLFRRKELEKEFFIECDCARCCDGTEFGTNYGGIISQEFCNHVFTPSNPRDEASPWVSDQAPGVELSGPECCRDLELLRRKCEEGLEETQGSASTIEFILSNPGEWDVLPRGGQVMMDIKKYLVQAYGNTYGSTYDVLDNEKIKAKIEICAELLTLYGKFHPGLNYSAAMIHYEAANAVCGLVTKGDKCLLEVGLSHCEAVMKICEVEIPGSLYDQLKKFMGDLLSGLKSLR